MDKKIKENLKYRYVTIKSYCFIQRRKIRNMKKKIWHGDVHVQNDVHVQKGK